MKWMELPIGSGLSRSASGGIGFGGKQTLSSGVTTSPRVDEALGVSLFARRRTDRFQTFAEFVVYNIYPKVEEGQPDALSYLSFLMKV